MADIAVVAALPAPLPLAAAAPARADKIAAASEAVIVDNNDGS
jgi:hypothetical protein